MAEIPAAVNREEILAGVNPAGSAPADGVLKSVAASLPTTVVDAIDQQNNEGKIHQTTNERLKNQFKSEPKHNEQEEIFYKPTVLNHTDLYKEYGNNYFELQTVDRGTNIVLAGILKELPEFSCSTEWEEGPGGTVGKAVKDYINDDTVQAINFLGGNMDYNPLLAMDALTERSFASTSYGDFELNFRIYPAQTIGSKLLTSSEIWLKSLMKFTAPESGNGIISKTAVEAISGTFDSGKKIMDSVINVIKGKNDDEGNYRNLINFSTESGGVLPNNNSDKFGNNRVFNTANSEGRFGAKLFELRLFPFIFKKPIPVYISNWSVSPSQECCIIGNHREHVFYDFKLTCGMDQIPSKTRWIEFF